MEGIKILKYFGIQLILHKRCVTIFQICIFFIYLVIIYGQENTYTAYLFAYFTGNSGNQEAIRFGLSTDGFNYKALNGNAPILSSDKISATGGVRDPHILRGINGKYYYMAVTDMVSANGWNSNHGIVLLKSTDLINWTSSAIDIKAKFSEFNTIDRAWAPQIIYDSAQKKYMVYFSLHKPGKKDIIYYSYTNDEFTDLISTPIPLYADPNNSSCIDADIVYKDKKYYLFHKNETGGGIYVAVSDKLTEGYVLVNKPVDQTASAVEGSCVFKLIHADTYVLLYDVYNSGTYQFTTSTDLLHFEVFNEVSMNFKPRHGTIIPITQSAVNLLTKKWGNPFNVSVPASNYVCEHKNHIVINTLYNTMYLPEKKYLLLKIYDLLGREVITLIDGHKKAGYYSLSLDGTRLSKGTYFYHVQSENFIEIKKMIYR